MCWGSRREGECQVQRLALLGLVDDLRHASSGLGQAVVSGQTAGDAAVNRDNQVLRSI